MFGRSVSQRLCRPTTFECVSASATTAEDEDAETYSPAFHHAAELIGRRWTACILKAIGDRALRFGEIRASIPGLSDRLLDTRLTELEAEGIVTRTTNHGEVRYSATRKGIGLDPIFALLEQWSQANVAAEQVTERPGRRRDSI